MASNLVVARGGVEFVPPISLAFWRWTVVFIILLPFIYFSLKKNSKIIEINNSILEIINKYQIYRKNCLISSKKFSKKNQSKVLKLFL